MAKAGPHHSRFPSRPVPRVGAFFDMDKTLISENSGSLYLKYLYDRGEMSEIELARGLGDYLRYKIGALDLRAWVEAAAGPLAGRSEESVSEEARGWFAERVISKIYPEAVDRVSEHLERGDVVAIVSGATRFIIEPLAERLRIAHVVCTQLEIARGQYTGRVIDPVCFEEGKVYWISEFAAQHGIDLARSWFYTDSITDLPLLERVGHPVVTNPDPLLYLAARRRQWPVLLFDSPR